jgi:hypothetical protein
MGCLAGSGKTHNGRKEHTSGAKAQTILKDLSARLNRLRKKYFPRRSLTAAAKADSENKPVTAAVNRCATQKRSYGSGEPLRHPKTQLRQR